MSEILFLAHRVPFPPNRGDTIRSAHILRALEQIAPVHVGCFSQSETDTAGIAELVEMAASHCIVPRTKPLVLAGAEAVLSGKPVSLTAFHSVTLEKWVKDTIAEYDISAIVVFSGQMGQYIPAEFTGRVVVDLCDVDSAKFQSYAESGERVWLNAREARHLAEVEEQLAHKADVTTLISEAEAALFASRLIQPAKANLQVMGNGIDANIFDPASVAQHEALDKQSGPHFVFTGQMDYRPNEAAALWAIEHFLPSLLQRFGTVQLHIVGRAPTTALLAKQGVPGLTIWGEVPDVKPFLAAADCVIAPLLIARGVQNKVLEAMAMARPVLLTPEAATGIAATDGEHWMVCEADAEAMAQRFLTLRADPALAKTMGTAARNFVLAQHAWDAMLAPLAQWVRGTTVGDQEKRNAA